jgi:hypothetical protein
MNTTTTSIAAVAANNGSLTTDASKVKAAYDALKKMISNQEIVLATFPVMGSYGLIPKEAIQAYLSQNSSEEEANTVLAKFSGEIFSTEKLKALEEVRKSVTDFMTTVGVLMGRSGVYAVPAKMHTRITQFLCERAATYEGMVADMLRNYDTIVTQHKAKLDAAVKNDAARLALEAKIPSRDKIQKMHECSYQFFQGYVPEEEDMLSCSEEILRAFEQEVSKNSDFVQKVADEFTKFLDIDTNAKDLGKKYASFNGAIEKALSYETSTKMILAGSQYEAQCNAQFELLHQAKTRLGNINKRLREANVKLLLEKFKQVAYVLSSERELEAYSKGQISVFNDFTLYNRKPNSIAASIVATPTSATLSCFEDQSSSNDDADDVVEVNPAPVEPAPAPVTSVAPAAPVVPAEPAPTPVAVPESVEAVSVEQADTLETLSLDEFEPAPHETAPVVETTSVSVPEKVTVEPQLSEEQLKEQRMKSIDEAIAELMKISPAEGEKTTVAPATSEPNQIKLGDTKFIF